MRNVAEMQLFKELFNQLKDSVYCADSKLLLHAPEFTNLEFDLIRKCIESGWVSSAGPFLDEFENKLCEFMGCKYAVAMSSGTSALQIAIICCGVRPGDEVLMPALTFVGTANAVAHAGAIPHFLDSDMQTLGICPVSLEKHLESTTIKSKGKTINKNTDNVISAIIPMHTFGHPVDIDPIMKIAKEYNLSVIEDAAEALGSKYKFLYCGTFGDAGIVSFNGNKIITTGGGGALITNNQEIAKKARHISSTAKVSHKYQYLHDEIGYNYRMPSLNAALGCAQISKLDDFIAKKRKLHTVYESIFAESKLASLVKEPKNSVSNYWLNGLILDEQFIPIRDTIIDLAWDLGVQCRPVWNLMPTLPMYRNCPSADINTARKIASSLISIPSGPGLIK